MLRHYVIYHHAIDFPQYEYVCRGFTIEPGTFTADPHLSGTAHDEVGLDAIRHALECNGFVKLGRHPTDDPRILETWI